MIIESIYCEKCNGEVGSLDGQYLCKDCLNPLSDKDIENKLMEMFQKHKPNT